MWAQRNLRYGMAAPMPQSSTASPTKPQSAPAAHFFAIEELLDLICHHTDPRELKALRLVDRRCSRVSTRYSHLTIVFSLAANWQSLAFPNHPDSKDLIEKWALQSQLRCAAFLRRHNIQPHTVVNTNWPMPVLCWFFHLFPSVKSVIFQGVACNRNNMPHIPSPYLLPNQIENLIIRGCLLEGNAIEDILSPGTRLKYLEIRRVHYGYLVGLACNFTFCRLTTLSCYSLRIHLLLLIGELLGAIDMVWNIICMKNACLPCWPPLNMLLSTFL